MISSMVVVFVLSLGFEQATAQQVPRIQLPPADAKHQEEFSSVTSVRELGDGRVLVTDGREQRIVVLDFKTGTATAVGRKGGGPGEYQIVSALHGVAGDTTLLGDFLQQRILVFYGASSHGQVAPDAAAVRATQAVIEGADTLGNLLVFRKPTRRAGVSETTRADSTAVLLVSRTAGRQDTVAMLSGPAMRYVRSTGEAGQVLSSRATFVETWPSREQAILFRDGWLAVARLEPFRVDWRSPRGVWSLGSALGVRRIPVDSREIQQYHARSRGSAELGPSSQSGALSDADAFPKFVPPFGIDPALAVAPGGVLLIRRARSADFSGNHYLAVDRRGRLLGQIDLASNQTIVGSGASSVYVGVRDEDDVVRVYRHRWSATTR